MMSLLQKMQDIMPPGTQTSPQRRDQPGFTPQSGFTEHLQRSPSTPPRLPVLLSVPSVRPVPVPTYIPRKACLPVPAARTVPVTRAPVCFIGPQVSVPVHTRISGRSEKGTLTKITGWAAATLMTVSACP
ncbi:hypothetical protein A0H81_06014 [Grifola frondosa]|uniref:Uncharacterized protein n=1 Tax=Grifola frondosa TaxID=5627 RepID=A0A1C7MB23_GRIFR|nr:hypothetical protein A0H81_06014 [Grifola frondosa]